MDAEDLRDLILRFERGAALVIERNGGFIARYMGDGVLVYFGYPQAHEDDAERAVRCGLELVDEVGSSDVSLRIGIASGSVVIGDLIGTGSAQEQAVVGQAPNLAARLQSMAEPHSVVIGPTTQALIGDLFDNEFIGEKNLKGFTDPVKVWKITGERTGASRFDPQRSRQSLLYGRDKELALLKEHWNLARQGQGRVVTLLAEAGMGKSRLAHELTELAEAEGGRVLRYNCAPHFQNTALYPVSSRIAFNAGFGRGDSADQKMAKLDEFLGQRDGNVPLRYIAAVISMLFGSAYDRAPENPEVQKEQTLQALEGNALDMAKLQPLLILFEDLHWSDHTTLELITRLANLINNAQVLILTTGRMAFQPPWAAFTNTESITLTGLSEFASRQIIAANAAQQTIPDHVYAQILRLSDSNPLYLEELTNSVVDSIDQLASQIEVPDTLQDSLMARLDGFDDARVKETAQLGAVIGREFPAELLTDISPQSADALAASLKTLSDSGLLTKIGDGFQTTYSFKHALLRDAAYASLLLSRRRKIHETIATILETQDAGAAIRKPELIAHHFSAATLQSRAIPYWQQAGAQASSSAAFKEAIDHFETALKLLPKIDDKDERVRLEFNLQGEIGLAQAKSKGYAAREVEVAFQRELTLSEDLGFTEKYSASRRTGTIYIVRAEFDKAKLLMDECVRIAQITQRATDLIDGYNGLGHIQGYTGALQKARASLDAALSVYDKKDGASLDYVTEQDPAMSALSLVGVIAWLLGKPDDAVAYKTKLTNIAARADAPFDIAYANTWAAVLENLRHDHETSLHHANVAIKYASQYGLDLWQHFATVIKARSEYALGRAPDAETQIKSGIAGYNSTGAILVQPYFKSLLAQTQSDEGMLESALATLNNAIAQAQDHKENFLLANLYQQRGDLFAALDRSEEAMNQWREAMTLAREQEAELAKITLLTRLARSPADARHDQSRDELATLVEQFPLQHQTIRELQDAKVVLA